MRLAMLLILSLLTASGVSAAELSFWQEGDTRTAILDYLQAISDPANTDFIPVAERVAVLDNDGTLWCERPEYPSNLFQASLLRSLIAEGHADSTQMPYRAWLDNDDDALREYGWPAAFQEMNAVFAGMPVAAYQDSALAFLDRTAHAEFGDRFPELYYAPMLELIRLLEAHEFQVWVVTGSEQAFMRSFIEEATGIPPERLIGAWTTGVYRNEDGRVTIVRGSEEVTNGYERKPGNIEMRIGRRPVFAAGNSNNDQPMCRYTVTGDHRSLAIWIHHDDEEREYAYDHTVDAMAALVAERSDVLEVSIRRDWVQVFRAGIGRNTER